MNLYYKFLKKIKNKNNYTVSMPHKHICTVNIPHSVTRQQICTVIWGRGFFRKLFFYEDGIQTVNFIGEKTENDLYYKAEKHY